MDNNDLRYDGYYIWLIEHIENERFNRENYSCVLGSLYKTDFTYIIPRDKNRAEDGLFLRDEFSKKTKLYPWFHLPDTCSVLEMLVMLARKMDDLMFYDPDDKPKPDCWFWIMLDNLGLTKLTDDVFGESIYENTIEKFLNRTYDSQGHGNIFYTNLATFDFRNIEIWYQMNSFVEEFVA